MNGSKVKNQTVGLLYRLTSCVIQKNHSTANCLHPNDKFLSGLYDPRSSCVTLSILQLVIILITSDSRLNIFCSLYVVVKYHRKPRLCVVIRVLTMSILECNKEVGSSTSRNPESP